MDENVLKVMIVDDEQSVRNLLRICINWEEAGMKIVSEASSGSEALEILEKVNPDIIFTDICMPFMDGLEFCRLAVEKYPHVKVIILTAHEEFEYAKRGIKIGVSEYILKPVNRVEIQRVVLSLKQKIELERSSKEQYERLKKQLEDNIPYLKEKYLNELIQNNPSMEESIRRNAEYFGIEGFENHVQAAIIETIFSDVEKEKDEEARLLQMMRCMELVKQFFRDDDCINVFYNTNQKIVILNSNPEIDLLECCEQLKTLIINRMKCFVCIGVGGIFQGYRNIRKSYKQAFDALNYKVVVGRNQVISYGDMSLEKPRNDTPDINDMEGLDFYIKAEIFEKAAELVDNFFHEMGSLSNFSIEQARVLSANAVSIVLSAVLELGISYREMFESGLPPYNKIFSADNLPDMKLCLKEYIRWAIDIIKSMRTRKVNSIVAEVVEYVEAHISDPALSLSATAKKFYLNQSYLSRIFKQETGQSFTEYLTKLRMKKALTLLKETDMKAYQVSCEVGIQDPNYFGICFKKYTGMSVNDYRKNK